jgi:hypothetical protein
MVVTGFPAGDNDCQSHHAPGKNRDQHKNGVVLLIDTGFRSQNLITP